jgi:hypothetical protein
LLALAAQLELVAAELERECHCPVGSYDQSSAHEPTCPRGKINPFDLAWAAHLRLDARELRLLAQSDRHRVKPEGR